MRITRALAVWLLAAGLAGSAVAEVPGHCQAPDDVAGPVRVLPHVAAALHAGATLKVLAIGSATIFGPAAAFLPNTITSQALSGRPATPPPAQPITLPPSELAFPQQMAKALETAVPGAKVDITVRGGRGYSAGEMLELIRQALAEGPYQLVIWQTGTIEAVRNTPPGDFASTLIAGAEAVEAAGADLVLIDPQFSRFLQTNSDLEPYQAAFQQVAAMQGVLLFHRFDLMRSWANDGQIDLERTPKGERHHTVERLHACLGAHLARMILEGARS